MRMMNKMIIAKPKKLPRVQLARNARPRQLHANYGTKL
jgi:hypothetical protein